MRFTKIFLAGLIAFGGLWTSDTYAIEKRCDDLGQNCVCSEPLNTTTYVEGPTGVYNPADSTTKQCTGDVYNDSFFTGYSVYQIQRNIYGSNDPTVLAQLPNRSPSLQYFLRAPEGHTGGYQIQHVQVRGSTRSVLEPLLPGTVQAGARTEYVSIKRAASRFYFYSSPNMQVTNYPNGTCTNGKRGGIDILTLSLGSEPGVPNMAYPFKIDTSPDGGWLPYKPDCCGAGPYNTGESAGPSISAYRGKWWRYEAVITNRLGGVGNGTRVQVFLKNITDNQPEIRVIDTNGTNPSPWWIPSPDLTPAQQSAAGSFVLQFNANTYRAGTCPGWLGYSHFMAAQWDTDTGQRIGPAYEVEGGGSLPSVPSSPTGLKTW